MRSLHHILVFLFAAGVLSCAEDADDYSDWQLVGVAFENPGYLAFINSKESRFFRWVRIGGGLSDGAIVQSYDANTKCAVLQKDGRQVRIQLQAAAIAGDKVVSDGTGKEIWGIMEMTFGGRSVRFRGRLRLDEAAAFDLGDGRSLNVLATRMDDGSICYSSSLMEHDEDGGAKKLTPPPVIAAAGQRFKLLIANDVFSFSPD